MRYKRNIMLSCYLCRLFSCAVKVACLFIFTTWCCFSGEVFGADESVTAHRLYNLDEPSEPWRTSKSGITTRIVPPYTAMVKQGSRVECWGRSYGLNDLFPTSVISQGQDILAKPVSLMLSMDGQCSKVKAKPTKFNLVRDDRIEFEAAGAVGPVEINAKSWIEYDGFIRINLTLTSDKPKTIDGLRLVFPFEPAAAIFHHLEMRWGPLFYHYERSPVESGGKTSYPWQPLVWLGNHDVGFTVVTETWNDWTSAEKGAITIQRNEEDLTLSLNIITRPTKLTGPLTYQFGLMATPAKPMRKDRWNIRIGAVPGVNMSYTWHFPSPEEKHFSYPEPKDFQATAEKFKKAHREGKSMVYYITTSATGDQSEVYKRNYRDWLMSKETFKGAEWSGMETGKGLIGAGSSCPASSFSDFLAWAIEMVMTHLDCDGVYIDNPGPYWCMNTLHGCGTGGKHTYPFFALRDLHKRLYTIVHTHKPNGFVWEHTSRTFNPLQLAWIDIYSDGEPFRNSELVPRERLLKVFDRTYMEVTGTGNQVGAVPCFISTIGVRSDGEWSNWLFSRILPWGQMVWCEHGAVDGSPAIGACLARDEFGLSKEPVDFYRPHELPKWFKVTGKNVLACLWQRKSDQALLAVLANWNDEAIRAEINDDVLERHLGPCIMTDAMTGANFPDEPLPHHLRTYNPYPNPFIFSIPADSFRMVKIERQGAE